MTKSMNRTKVKMTILEVGSDFRSDEDHQECNRKKKSAGNASCPGYKGLQAGGERALAACAAEPGVSLQPYSLRQPSP